MQNPEQRIRSLLLDAERKQVDARDRGAALLREADMHSVTVSAYRTALAAFGGDAEANKTDSPSTAQLVAPKRGTTSGGAIPGGPKWFIIFARLAQDSPSPYGYTEIAQAAESSGQQISVSALRTQMMGVVNAGLFRREGAGKFVMTDRGREMIVRPLDNGASAGASNAKAEKASDLLGFLNPNPAQTGA